MFMIFLFSWLNLLKTLISIVLWPFESSNLSENDPSGVVMIGLPLMVRPEMFLAWPLISTSWSVTTA